MNNTLTIKTLTGQGFIYWRVCEPTVGKWYCACTYVEDLDSASGRRENYGILAEYVGGGEFYDGDSDETQTMRYADFLIEQN